jgi:hypothetical protein
MKKSMLALFSCALVAGSVMAAEVAGNNTAVVIQKTPVVSSNFYQFLIVPVKGFDITGNPQSNPTITLNELLPASLYDEGTLVYKANSPTKQYKIVDGVWTWNHNDGATFSAKDVLWLKSTKNPMPDTVFCGQLLEDNVNISMTDEDVGTFIAFGNATSMAVPYSDIKVNGGVPANDDEIYVIQGGSSNYKILVYFGGKWWKPPAGTGSYVEVGADEELPAGAAAYYYRAQ